MNDTSPLAPAFKVIIIIINELKHCAYIAKKISVKKVLLTCWIPLVILSGIPNSLIAQEGGIEELLQEFFIAETVYPQEKKEVQITSRPAYWKNQEGNTLIFPLQFEYGFTDRFQFELQLPYTLIHSGSGENLHGFGNTEAGLLYNLLNKKSLALSVSLDIAVPTQKRGKDEEVAEVEWEPSLIIARQIGRMQLHGGFAAEMSKREVTFNYNLASVFPYGNWKATFEINVLNGEDKAVFITPGVVWKKPGGLEFGLGIPKNILKGNAGFGIILMLTHEFSLSKDE